LDAPVGGAALAYSRSFLALPGRVESVQADPPDHARGVPCSARTRAG